MAEPDASLSWDFKLSHPGTFEVALLTSEQKYGKGWKAAIK